MRSERNDAFYGVIRLIALPTLRGRGWESKTKQADTNEQLLYDGTLHKERYLYVQLN